MEFLGLSPPLLEQFRQDGFLIFQDYISKAEIAGIRSRIEVILSEFDMSQVSVFSTTNQTKTSDRYFLESGDKIRCFFEEEAFDGNGKLIKAKEFSINKIGHALHDLDPEFKKVSYKKELLAICRDIGMKDPLMVQSQYIFKQPGIGGKVVAHRDSTFIYTDPKTCVGFWMALEDATMDNGCLMAIPGSHLTDHSSLRFVRTSDGENTKFLGTDESGWDLDKMVPLEAGSGDLVILHGSLVHMSWHNRSSRSRHAYIIHMVDAYADWPEDNWLQRPQELSFKHLADEII